MTSPPHITWLKDSGKTLTTTAGQEIRMLEFEHTVQKGLVPECDEETTAG
jgi:hypothetical protein